MRVEGNCEICGVEIEVQICCDGCQCGCMGLPVEPPLCNKDKCWRTYQSLTFNQGKY